MQFPQLKSAHGTIAPTFDLQKGQRALWESSDRSQYICKHHPAINPKQTIHLDANETKIGWAVCMSRNSSGVSRTCCFLNLARSVKVSSCSKTKRAERVDKLRIRRIKQVNLWTSEIKGGRSERGGEIFTSFPNAIFHSRLKHAAISPIRITGNSLGRRRLPRATAGFTAGEMRHYSTWGQTLRSSDCGVSFNVTAGNKLKR